MWAAIAAAQDEYVPENDQASPPAQAAPAPGPAPAPGAPPAPTGANTEVVLQGLDKVTARISTIDAPLNQAVHFGTLEIVPHACFKAPPEEEPESAAFLEIDDVKPGEPKVPLFTGWMFASSPGLHAVEHPIYDIWLTDCAQPAGGAVAQAPAPPSATAPAGSGRKAATPRVPAIPPARAPAPATDD